MKKNPAKRFNSAAKNDNRIDVFNRLTSGLGDLAGKKVLLLPAAQGHEIPMYRARGVIDSDFYFVDHKQKVLDQAVAKHKVKGAHLYAHSLKDAVPFIRADLKNKFIDIANLDTCQVCGPPLEQHTNAVLNGGILSFKARIGVTFVDARQGRGDWKYVPNHTWIRQVVSKAYGWSINEKKFKTRDYSYQNKSPMCSTVMQLQRKLRYKFEKPVIHEPITKPVKLPPFVGGFLELSSSGKKAGISRKVKRLIDAVNNGERLYITSHKPSSIEKETRQKITTEHEQMVIDCLRKGLNFVQAAEKARPGCGRWLHPHLSRKPEFRKQCDRARRN